MADFKIVSKMNGDSIEMLKDRGMSILEFNKRVLSMAFDKETPLMERMNFIKIVESNIEEFLSLRMPSQKSDLYFQYKDYIENLHTDMDSSFMLITDVLSKYYISDYTSEVLPQFVSEVIESYSENKLYLAFTDNGNDWHIGSAEGKYVDYIIDASKFSFFFKLISDKSMEYLQSGSGIEKTNDEIEKLLDAKDDKVFLYMLCDCSNKFIINKVLDAMNIDIHDIIYTPDNVLRVSELIKHYDYITKNNPDLKYPNANINPVQYENMLSTVKSKKSMLIRVPYESYDYILNFIHEACTTDEIQNIFITLYRTAKESEIVNSLCIAAKKHKNVYAYVESLARGNESLNVENIKKLKRAGAIVANSFKGYKVHAKLFLAIAHDGTIYSHIGTGNYNEDTARFYTDSHILTTDFETGRSIIGVFQFLFSNKFNYPLRESNSVFISPFNSRTEILRAIDAEIEKGSQGCICLKCNSLCDHELIERLEKADRASVNIKLIIRTGLSIIPTNNIQVKSKVGRYLEHDRIYIIGNQYYIGSADLLLRNLDKRIECIYKVFNKDIQLELQKVFDTMWLSDIHYLDPITLKWTLDK